MNVREGRGSIVTLLTVTLLLGVWWGAVSLGQVPGRRGGRRSEAPRTPPNAGQVRAEPQVRVPSAPRVALRIEFGSRVEQQKKVPTTWDGSIRVSPGRVVAVRSWWQDPRDIIEGSSWKLTTRRSIPWNIEQRKRGHEAMPLQDSALLVELADVNEDTEVSLQTVQGNFTFRLGPVLKGEWVRLAEGLILVHPAAVAERVLEAPTEDDMVSAAVGPDGAVHVVYVAFRHGEGFERREQLEKEPTTFADLAKPTGGDQVRLMTLRNGQWEGPVDVTPPGGDVYRPAVAVDAENGVWVVWSAKDRGRWDLFARRRLGGEWATPIRLTDSAGPDLFPTAVRAADGRVWVAWMAFNDSGHSDILVAHQEGRRFSKPETIAGEPGNQWSPAIAAAQDGRIAVAWDSYEAGNYDVFVRIWKDGRWGERLVAAGSLQAEKRPALAFDAAGRLWAAWEVSPPRWGKDWGPTVKEEERGVALYQNRSVAVQVWDGRGWQVPIQPAAEAFSAPALVRGGQARQARRGNLALPVLASDPQGRIWLAVRTSQAGTRVGVGTVWYTHVARYEGDRWSSQMIVDGTDHSLDSRPSLVVLPEGRVAMIASSDGRAATASRLPDWFVRELRAKGETVPNLPLAVRWADPVNCELVWAWLPMPAAPAAAARLQPMETAPTVAGPDELARKEAAQVEACRSARITVGGKTLRLLRGEFHRHTEISSDGGGDGMLMDMWRYGLDAAALDWIGNGDHDNGNGREYPWWITQKTTDLFQIPRAFAPVYSYERSVSYPDGHRNVVFAHRGVRTLPRLQGGMGKAMDEMPEDAVRPNSPDTQMLYKYLLEHDGICASHTSATDMGTDWRDHHPKVEPVVEIFQGCRQNYEMPGAPRANTAEHSIGGWRPLGFVSLALKKGYRLGFQASSDHVSTHISYCNVWAEDITPEAIVRAMKARHVYGATDNIIADVRCGEHFMGDEFTTRERPTLTVRLRGTAPWARVHVIKDGAYAHTVEPGRLEVEFQWTDLAAREGATSYYYVRGEQTDGQLVWVSPMWITFRP